RAEADRPGGDGRRLRHGVAAVAVALAVVAVDVAGGGGGRRGIAAVARRGDGGAGAAPDRPPGVQRRDPPVELGAGGLAADRLVLAGADDPRRADPPGDAPD